MTTRCQHWWWLLIAVVELALIAGWAVVHADQPPLALGGALFGLGAYLTGIATVLAWRTR